ncbi:MAG: MBL fold metallo-hydrolase [Sphingomonadaceae bacterium]
MKRRHLIATITTLWLSAPAIAAADTCSAPVAVQILGSGGPIAEGSRAGASAIVWIGGKAALLVDAGSGAFIRYGEAGVKFEDHRAILITHFHGDHVSDLAAILNSGTFADRSAPLPIIGPAGSARFSGVTQHLRGLFDKKVGALPYLAGYLTGDLGLPQLQPVNVSVRATSVVINQPDLKVTAIPVVHGDVPALGYLIETGGKSIVFSGDQNFMSDQFVTTLKGRKPDILIAHNVIPEGEGQPRGLHRWPTSIGEMAAAINPKRLILSHNMKRALIKQAEGETAIRTHYTGPMVVANDLDCFVP